MHVTALADFRSRVKADSVLKTLKLKHEVVKHDSLGVTTLVRCPRSHFGAELTPKVISKIKCLAENAAKERGVYCNVSVPGSKAYVEIEFMKRLNLLPGSGKDTTWL